MPCSTADRIAILDSSSSCVPQAQRHPAPPRAHAPNPTRVILISVVPKRVVGKVSACVVIFVPSLGDNHLAAQSGDPGCVFLCPTLLTTGAIRLFLTNADDRADRRWTEPRSSPRLCSEVNDDGLVVVS